MHGVGRKVHEERHAVGCCAVDLFAGMLGDSLGKKDVFAVILFETRHIPYARLFCSGSAGMAEVVSAEV